MENCHTGPEDQAVPAKTYCSYRSNYVEVAALSPFPKMRLSLPTFLDSRVPK